MSTFGLRNFVREFLCTNEHSVQITSTHIANDR